MEINWELLQRCRDFLATEVQPERFNMTDYLVAESLDSVDDLMDRGAKEIPCGTAGCVLGHCVLNPNLNPDRLDVRDFYEVDLNITHTSYLWDFLFSGTWEHYLQPGESSLQLAIHRLDQFLAHKDTPLGDLNAMCGRSHFSRSHDLITE